MKCNKCGADNPDSAKFCHECGAELKREDFICPKCGEKVAFGDKFCPNCGNQLKWENVDNDNIPIKVVKKPKQKEQVTQNSNPLNHKVLEWIAFGISMLAFVLMIIGLFGTVSVAKTIGLSNEKSFTYFFGDNLSELQSYKADGLFGTYEIALTSYLSAAIMYYLFFASVFGVLIAYLCAFVMSIIKQKEFKLLNLLYLPICLGTLYLALMLMNLGIIRVKEKENYTVLTDITNSMGWGSVLILVGICILFISAVFAKEIKLLKENKCGLRENAKLLISHAGILLGMIGTILSGVSLRQALIVSTSGYSYSIINNVTPYYFAQTFVTYDMEYADFITKVVVGWAIMIVGTVGLGGSLFANTDKNRGLVSAMIFRVVGFVMFIVGSIVLLSGVKGFYQMDGATSMRYGYSSLIVKHTYSVGGILTIIFTVLSIAAFVTALLIDLTKKKNVEAE